MRIVAVANQKGGVGKSTVAMSLAAIAAETARVLVVDVDPQNTATDWAEKAGDNLPFAFSDEKDPTLLARMREMPFDLVIVDTPGNTSGEAARILDGVLQAADFVVMPIEPAPASVKPLIATLRTHVLPAGTDYKVLINRHDPRDGTSVIESTVAALDEAGINRFNTIGRTYKVHTTAPGVGHVVTQYPGKRAAERAAEDFRKMHTELLAHWAHNASHAGGDAR